MVIAFTKMRLKNEIQYMFQLQVLVFHLSILLNQKKLNL